MKKLETSETMSLISIYILPQGVLNVMFAELMDRELLQGREIGRRDAVGAQKTHRSVVKWTTKFGREVAEGVGEGGPRVLANIAQKGEGALRHLVAPVQQGVVHTGGVLFAPNEPTKVSTESGEPASDRKGGKAEERDEGRDLLVKDATKKHKAGGSD